jgi:hypothetical protein
MKATGGVGLILCGVLIVAGIGLSASGAQVGFNKGELDATYSAPYNKTWKAVHDGLMSIDWIWVYKTQRDSTGGIIEAWGKNQTHITVTVRPMAPNTTSVKIQVGTFGDEAQSLQINEAISAQLKALKK